MPFRFTPQTREIPRPSRRLPFSVAVRVSILESLLHAVIDETRRDVRGNARFRRNVICMGNGDARVPLQPHPRYSEILQLHSPSPRRRRRRRREERRRCSSVVYATSRRCVCNNLMDIAPRPAHSRAHSRTDPPIHLLVHPRRTAEPLRGNYLGKRRASQYSRRLPRSPRARTYSSVAWATMT